jgi:MYXO-CTERM domain-containing protein
MSEVSLYITVSYERGTPVYNLWFLAASGVAAGGAARRRHRAAQGNLAHKKAPTPLGPPLGPRHGPSV